MQPIQPAQRVERPPPPASPVFNIDSPDDEESDTTTEVSCVLSEQFPMLQWPDSTGPEFGRESPIPLVRGVSPESSVPQTTTPESSLTAWSGAVVVHNYGHPSGAAANTAAGRAAGIGVGTSWASASRDIATFNLLRANSGRAGNRDRGGSGRLRPGANAAHPTPSSSNATSANKNAALTEENVEFLRQVSAGAKGGDRRVGRGSPQNSGRPPKVQRGTSSPTHAAGMAARGASPRHCVEAAAAAAVTPLSGKRTTDPASPGQDGELRVSPVSLDQRGRGAIVSTTTAEDSISNLATQAAAQTAQKPAAAVAGGHVTATQADSLPLAVAAATTTVTNQPLKDASAADGTADRLQPAVPETKPASPPAAAALSPTAAPRSAHGSAEGRPRRTSSRHEGQVLPPEVSAADMPEAIATTTTTVAEPPPIPSPTAAARRRATTAAREPVAPAAPTGSSPAGTTAAPASGGAAVTRPTPAKRAATAASKVVPGAPAQYMSRGRLVLAAQRIAVRSPVDTAVTTKAPTSGGAVPKTSERRSPLAKDLSKAKPNGVPSPFPPALDGQATRTKAEPNPSSTRSSNNRTSNDEPAAAEMGSFASCSVQTISPAKARELRVLQPNSADATTADLDGIPVEQTTAVTLPNTGVANGAAPSTDTTSKGVIATPMKDTGKATPTTPLRTVEVARLTAGPPPNRVFPAGPRAAKSPAAAAATMPTPPPSPPVTGTPTAPPAIALSKQPSTATCSPSDTSRPTAAKTRSTSPHGSEDSLTRPPTPSRSRRSVNTGQSRRSVNGSRSSNNTSRDFNTNTSTEYPLSVASTQLPLSVRQPVSSLQETQPTNGRSTSGDGSDRGEHETSFTSTFSTSANHSGTENEANPAAAVGEVSTAARRTADPSPRLLSLDGKPPAAGASPTAAGPLHIVSPPTSTQLNTALRARRSSHAVGSGAAEQPSLADRRASAPAQVERRSAPTDTSPPLTTAEPAATVAPGRRSCPRATVGGNTSGAPTAAASPVMVGKRPLPRVFPTPDGNDGSGGTAAAAGVSSTATTPANGPCVPPEAERTATFLANRRRAHSLPAGSLGHGANGAAAPGDVGSTANGSPALGRGFNVTKETGTDTEGQGEPTLRAESNFREGTAAPPSRRSRKAVNVTGEKGNENDALGGGGGGGGLLLPPTLATNGRLENKDAVFQSSPPRLPPLTRFPHTSESAAVTDTPPAPPPVRAHFIHDIPVIGQSSSASGHTSSKDSTTLPPSARRRPSNQLADDGADTVCNSNASSVNNRTTGAHSEGSTNGETPNVKARTRPFHKKPHLHQRTPSMNFF